MNREQMPADRAAAPVKQRADCTETEWAEQERARFERLYTRETVRTDEAEARATATEAEIRSLAGQRDRYHGAWRSARERAQAYGEGILRAVKDREQWQRWCRKAEAEVVRLATERDSLGREADRLRTDWVEMRTRAEQAEADRAVVLDEAIRRVEDLAERDGLGWESAREVLHRMAAEVERPLSPYFEHPECGFRWHGRDGMDVPMRDDQPVCPRCELAKVRKQLGHSLRRREEVGAECKRRGRNVLEQAERLVRLERELDGVRDQLGKEMLRADDADSALDRFRRTIGRLVAHAAGFQDVLDESDCGPWGKTVGADIAELRRMAAEARAADTQGGEALPQSVAWQIEFLMRGKWHPDGPAWERREDAVARYQPATTRPWRRPMRLVRTTTTYVVEAKHTPSREEPQP